MPWLIIYIIVCGFLFTLSMVFIFGFGFLYLRNEVEGEIVTALTS